jgi:hypothetical protein
MPYFCHKCSAEQKDLANPKVGRRDSCESCNSDLHVCYNCLHYDKNSYNECKESQADRVLEKNRSNFCDYFSFKNTSGATKLDQNSEKKEQLKKLDDLFR